MGFPTALFYDIQVSNPDSWSMVTAWIFHPHTSHEWIRSLSKW